MNRRKFLATAAVSTVLSRPSIHTVEANSSTLRAKMFFLCDPANDLYRLAATCWPGIERYHSVDEILQQASVGAGVLFLADGYPETGITLTTEQVDIVTRKHLRVYVEYPTSFPDLPVASPRETKWERAVVASDAFGDALPYLRILAIHGCHFVPIRAANPNLVLARVAGFDTAVYGLPPTTYPILFKHPHFPILVSATKLSQFVTARYAPKDAWKVVWQMILHWLQPEIAFSDFDWTPVVRPNYARDVTLLPEALQQAVIRGVEWHTRARLLVHSSWEEEYQKYGMATIPLGPRPDPNWPSGDGELGLLEGFNSRISVDGSQDVRCWLRTDCNGESSLAFALRAKLDGDGRSRKIAGNLLDWVYFKSGLMHDDPTNANFGLLSWTRNERGTFYQDNDVKAILGGLGTAAVLNSDRWDKALLKNILGNFRTTGVKGFRGQFLDDKELQREGWQHYWKLPTIHYSPHFEAWIWAAYLWLYDKTHFSPLLQRTKGGITQMMNAYPAQWQWTNGLQQERARMLLALAWLVRVENTSEHRAWLKEIADDILADQVECGAIREKIGAIKMGQMPPPASNEAYGTNEAPLIQQNGDPVADLLYTCNFALLGLHEAAAATGNSQYQKAKEKLIDFILRIQIRSEIHTEFDGAWFRAFDFNRWEYWASNSDSDWGAWCIECGWTQGWINSVLAMHALNMNLWDLSQHSGITKHMHEIRQLMLPDDLIASS